MKTSSIKARFAARKKPLWKRGGFWAVLVVVLLAGGGAGWYFWMGPGARSSSAAQSTTENYTAMVQRGTIQIAASGSGTLTVAQSVDLSFSAKGTVSELKVKLGDTVKAGDVLARLGSAQSIEANIASLQLQLLQAKKTITDLQSNADVSLAQAYETYLTAQDTLTSAQEKVDKLAFGVCSKEVRTKYQSAIDNANERLTKFQDAPESAQYINAQNDLSTAQANYNACFYSATDQATAKSSLEVAKANLKKAEDTYNTLKTASGIDPDTLATGEAKVKAAETSLASAQEDLQGLTLTAPIAGKVTYLAASQGAAVDTSKFITISDVYHPTVNVSVDSSDMEKFTVGSAAEVSFDALEGQVFTGKVTQVNPTLITSGQYKVLQGTIALDDTAVKTVQNLPLGLSATVTIINQEAKNAVIAPIAALKDLGDNQYAVMVVKNGQMRLTMVIVGLKDATYAEIKSGLNPGDIVSTGTVQAASHTTSSSSSSTNLNQQGGDFGPGGPPPAP